MISVELDSQPIELCKLLKVANVVGGGGEAKIVISEGYVLVNNEVEYQKRKKIYHQDIIEFNGDIIEVICNTPVNIALKKAQKPKEPQKSQSQSQKSKKQPLQNSNKKIAPSVQSGRRKKISF